MLLFLDHTSVFRTKFNAVITQFVIDHDFIN